MKKVIFRVFSSVFILFSAFSVQAQFGMPGATINLESGDKTPILAEKKHQYRI